jgi:hypothetical protein
MGRATSSSSSTMSPSSRFSPSSVWKMSPVASTPPSRCQSLVSAGRQYPRSGTTVPQQQARAQPSAICSPVCVCHLLRQPAAQSVFVIFFVYGQTNAAKATRRQPRRTNGKRRGEGRDRARDKAKPDHKKPANTREGSQQADRAPRTRQGRSQEPRGAPRSPSQPKPRPPREGAGQTAEKKPSGKQHKQGQHAEDAERRPPPSACSQQGPGKTPPSTPSTAIRNQHCPRISDERFAHTGFSSRCDFLEQRADKWDKIWGWNVTAASRSGNGLRRAVRSLRLQGQLGVGRVLSPYRPRHCAPSSPDLGSNSNMVPTTGDAA